jgi:hypothetical protein
MRLLLGFLIGALLGAGCGVGVIYINPLIATAPVPADAGPQALRYSLGGPHLLASTHNELLPLPVTPADTPLLWESGVRGSWLQLLVLEDATGAPGGVATRLNVPAERSNGLTAGLITGDQWLITVPGRGVLYARGRSNVWPIVKDTVVRVDLLGRDWVGPERYDLLSGSTGPGAEVFGISGEFTGQSGTLKEVLELDDYPGTGLAGLRAEVRLDLTGPEEAAQSTVAANGPD